MASFTGQYIGNRGLIEIELRDDLSGESGAFALQPLGQEAPSAKLKTRWRHVQGLTESESGCTSFCLSVADNKGRYHSSGRKGLSEVLSNQGSLLGLNEQSNLPITLISGSREKGFPHRPHRNSWLILQIPIYER
jgi:hypothetical protein